MTILLVSPIVLSAIVLAAHFLRGGQVVLVAISLALPFLLLVRRPWAGWLLSVTLGLGAIEWVLTLVDLAQLRIAAGQPWTRMAIILGTVAGITAASALLPHTRRLRLRSASGGDASELSGSMETQP